MRGVDTGTGDDRVVLLHTNEVADVLTPVFDQVAAVARRVLEDVPEPVAITVLAEPVLLTGGMARVHGLREQFARAVGATVAVLDAPAQSVAEGLRRAAHCAAVTDRPALEGRVTTLEPTRTQQPSGVPAGL